MQDKPIVILGATGKTGRRIVSRLTAANVNVRGASRKSSPSFQWFRPETWDAVLQGARALYIAFSPDLAIAQAPDIIKHLLDRAKVAGIERVVLLSGRGERNAQRCEQLVAQSGIPYVLLRCSWFCQNFDEGELLPGVLQGVIAMPAGKFKEPLVDLEDVAEIAVAALTQDKHLGQLYEITGPALLSFEQVAAEMTEAIGRQITYIPLSFEEFHEAVCADAGRDAADLLTELCREVFDGRNEWVGDGVKRALGREPGGFSAYCQRIAATGLWTIAGDTQ